MPLRPPAPSAHPRRRVQLVLLAVLLPWTLVATTGLAETVSPDEPPVEDATQSLVVGTKVAPPFVMKTDDGGWTGLSIELWQAVAEDLGLAWELRELPSVDALLAGVEDGSLDLAVAALTISPEREARIDFSHPFYISGLDIAVPVETEQGFFAALRGLMSIRFLQVLSSLSLVLLLAGALLWLAERKRNEQFAGGTAQGLGAAFWWSAVTMTTVGYGDKAPVTFLGRLVALVWMFASVIMISGFTAAIASSLTVQQLEQGVQGPEDLPHFRVGTVAQTSSSDQLDAEGIGYRTYAAAGDALQALVRGELDALVYDAPILRHQIREGFAGRARVLGRTFHRQDYGIALEAGDPLREPLNQALLERLCSPWWPERVHHYLGD